LGGSGQKKGSCKGRGLEDTNYRNKKLDGNPVPNHKTVRHQKQVADTGKKKGITKKKNTSYDTTEKKGTSDQ